MPNRPGSPARPKGEKGPASGRTPDGRFVPGHSLPGPGNPHLQRIREYNAALREAINAGDLVRLMRKLLLYAERGDMAAAKLVLDRTMGKANTAPVVVEGADLGIEALANTDDIKHASEAILKAMTDGRISADDGAKLATVVELVRRSIETHDLAERIAKLEEEHAT